MVASGSAWLQVVVQIFMLYANLFHMVSFTNVIQFII